MILCADFISKHKWIFMEIYETSRSSFHFSEPLPANNNIVRAWLTPLISFNGDKVAETEQFGAGYHVRLNYLKYMTGAFWWPTEVAQGMQFMQKVDPLKTVEDVAAETIFVAYKSKVK